MRPLIRWIDKHAAVIMAAIAALYLVYAGALSAMDHFGLRTQLSDLGHMEQAIWQITQGDPAMTQSDPALNLPRMRVHANVIFYLIAPFYALFPSPVTLLLLGTAAVASAGFLFFLLARHVLNSHSLALLFGVAFLANPLVQEANLYDFHPIVLAFPLFLAVLLFQEKRQWAGYWLALLLLLSVKETLLPVAAAIGVYVTIRSSKKHGLITILAAATYFFALSELLPLATGFPVAELQPRFDYLGATPKEALVKALTSPGELLGVVLPRDKLTYLAYLAPQGSFLAVLSPLAALWALPPIAFNLLDLLGFQVRITGAYHSGLVITAAYAAALYGLRFVSRRRPGWSRGLIGLFVLQAAAISLVMSPTPYGLLSSWRDFRLNHDYDKFADIATLIPPRAALSTQNGPAAHLAARDIVVKYPHNTQAVDYILLHVHDPTNCNNGMFFADSPSVAFPSWTGKYKKETLDPAFAENDFGVLAYRPPWYLFKRGHNRQLNAKAYEKAMKDLRRYPPYAVKRQLKCNSVDRLQELYAEQLSRVGLGS